MRSEDKQSKAEVKYGPGKLESHCGICQHFYAPDVCSLVNGVISSKGWCTLFARKKGTTKMGVAEKSWSK